MSRAAAAPSAALAPWVVILAGVSAAVHVGKLPPAVPVLQADLGIGLVQAGVLLSLVQLGAMLLGLVAGLTADSLGLRRCMLAGLALQRGRFLSNLAEKAAKSPYAGPKMFLLGLFSLLDAMLDQPMEEIVESIPMDKSMKSGLCGKKSPALSWLHMLDNLDANNWKSVRTFLKSAGIEQAQAAKAYLDATRWSRLCFQAAASEKA